MFKLNAQKQEEAWIRLRAQEEEINGRNMATINRVQRLYSPDNINASRFHTSYGAI